uniref:Dolichyl-diphosphooligosaccharide--protein glycosyltransferase subunit 1 n=1 Tax=Parascaris univalens TaxID=6257 RepID=A0A915B6B2_PARUN
MRMLRIGLLLLCYCTAFCVAQFEGISIEAERHVDISSQVVKVTVKYQVTNGGKTDINAFVHLVSDAEQSKLSYIMAAEEKKDGKLHVVKTNIAGIKQGFTAYKVELLTAVTSGAKVGVTVEYHLAQYLLPYPAKITQSEAQFMLYKGSAHIASPYVVTKETTIIQLAPGKLLSHTTVAPTKSDSGKITYGPYTDQKPFTVSEIKVHSENNSPFVVVTNLERTIEISHWGNIAVEEFVKIVHKGAELTGPFSRLDHQLDHRTRRPVVTSYKTLLPASSKDIYYRDEIGNISTSSVRRMTDAVELTIQPRFPLFGGWRTDYVLGYNVPAYQYLYASGNSFALKMRLMDHVFDNSVVEHFKLKIILPEGSRNFKLITPYSVKRSPDELHFTYLDTTGRPVITVEKDNLVDAHIQPFTLHYEFDRIQLWREPLLACAGFGVLFLIVIIYVRFDFTIASDVATESRLQAQGQIEQLTDLHADRLRSYDHFIDASSKYRSSKDAAAFASAKKKAESDVKNTTQLMMDIQAELKANNAEISEKLNEVNKMNKTAMELITNYMTQVERLLKGQIQKGVFTEAEKAFNQKLNEIKEKMDAIIYAL